MNIMEHSGPTDMIVLALQPGEMLLESIRRAIKQKNIRNGVVVSGIGTLKTLQVYYIKHTRFPPAHGNVTIKRPLELLSVSGIIADGEPHLHVVASCGRDETYGGHLEPETEVAYLAEIAIIRCNSLKMARHLDKKRKINLLGRR